LGIRPKPVFTGNANQIIPSDNDVAVFWITNPNNTVSTNSLVTIDGNTFQLVD